MSVTPPEEASLSLRDQLLAKGLASKRDAQRVERELQQSRRAQQGNRRSKSELEAEQRAAEQAALQEQARARAERRAAADAAREAWMRGVRARDLVAAHRQRRGSGQPWWIRRPDGTVERTEVSSGVAHELRAGTSALVELARASGVELVVVPAEVARRLAEIAPERIVVWVTDTVGISDPAERFLERTEPTLRPRRATPHDLLAWRTRAR